jgi:hypothetical protein
LAPKYWFHCGSIPEPVPVLDSGPSSILDEAQLTDARNARWGGGKARRTTNISHVQQIDINIGENFLRFIPLIPEAMRL